MLNEKHILIVDDVNTNLKCASEVLKDHFNVSMVKSGKQALKFLKDCIPDLILLDISMPEMDGYETMEKIRENPVWKDIPVIFLTADTDGESEIKGLRMGAMDYIRKPFEPAVMLSRVEKVIRIEEDKRTLEICAKKDALTGLWNRRFLEEKLQECSSKENACGAFFLMDLDNFKAVNDNLGHLVGDAVLVQFAKCLKEYGEENDILCRIGGDEFVMFFDGLTDTDIIKKIAKSINTEVSEKVNCSKGPGNDISVSIGISIMPENGTDLHTLYNKSDKALYFVKENGKRGYHFYQEKDKMTLDRNMNIQQSTVADLMQLKKLIQENNQKMGAFEVEYEGFRKVYQFVSRSVKRSKRNVQIVLFTMYEKTGVIQEIGGLEIAMKDMNEAIVKSLRKGDVATQYSSTQFIVILMDTDTENGVIVAERIRKAWLDNSIIGAKCFTLTYDLERFETSEEKENND